MTIEILSGAHPLLVVLIAAVFFWFLMRTADQLLEIGKLPAWRYVMGVIFITVAFSIADKGFFVLCEYVRSLT